MLKIRLQRTGKKNTPSFRVVLTQSIRAPKGKYIELLGFYNPILDQVKLEKERIQYWISCGVKVSDTVHNLLVSNGIIKGPKKDKVGPSKKEPSKESPAPQESKPEETQKQEFQKEKAPEEEVSEEEPLKKEPLREEAPKEEVSEVPREEPLEEKEAVPAVPEEIKQEKTEEKEEQTKDAGEGKSV